MRQVDIMPTILDIVGLPIPKSIHGVSLLPRMKGKGEEGSLPAISESILGGYQSTPEQERTVLRSMRTEDWKLVYTQGSEVEVYELFNLRKDPGETTDVLDVEREMASELKKKLHAGIIQMQTKRLAMLTKEKVQFNQDDVPRDAKLEKPVVLSPEDRGVIRLNKESSQLVLRWTGDRNLTYVIQYDVGKDFRNLKGSIPVQGTRKVFGPLPREAWEPLPYWNPYRIRISPYGLEEYWSDWIEFSIEAPPKRWFPTVR
jgi:hypothetical protein